MAAKKQGQGEIAKWYQPDCKPGENAKFINLNAELFNLPSIDLDDEKAVAEQLDKYFQIYAKYEVKPTVTGLAIVLGHNRNWLLAVVTDKPTGGSGYKAKLRPSVACLIKKAYDLIANLWEVYMQSGKINPVAGIFLAKNNFGYRDQTEHVLTPNTATEDIVDAEEIKKRYLSDSDNSED